MPPSRTPTPKCRTSLVPKTPPSGTPPGGTPPSGTKLVVVKTIMPQRTASGWTLTRPFQVVRRVPIEPESSPTSTVKNESMDDGMTASPSPSPATEAGHQFTAPVSERPSGRASSITLPVRAKMPGTIAGTKNAASATGHMHGPPPGASLTLPIRTVASKGLADVDGDVEMEGEGEEDGDHNVKREEGEG